MRRALAITILFFFGLPMAAPLFAADAAADLPACCRRDGRHHCGAGMTADPSGRTVSAIAPRCPSWPKSTPAPAHENFAPPPSRSLSAALYARPESAPQTEARYRAAFARSRQKRGPPAILL